jgi:hypothetical protein
MYIQILWSYIYWNKKLTSFNDNVVNQILQNTKLKQIKKFAYLIIFLYF